MRIYTVHMLSASDRKPEKTYGMESWELSVIDMGK